MSVCQILHPSSIAEIVGGKADTVNARTYTYAEVMHLLMAQRDATHDLTKAETRKTLRQQVREILERLPE